jgi:hypothetical protein
MKMLLVLAVLAVAFCLQAQEWSAPVNVSNMNGTCYSPDYCIDSDGFLHCVWVFQYQYFERRIMYSKSTDNGISWSTPLQISESTPLWMEKPQIECDTQNNLHVIYNYDVPNASQIHYRELIGQNWGDIVNLSGSGSGQLNYSIAVDGNDKVYVFWGIANEEDYHTYLYLYDNNNWSNVLDPFSQSQDHFLVTSTIVDSNNYIHCAGYFHFSNATFMQDKAGYAFYDSQDDEWSDIVFFDVGNVRLYEGIDITLDVDEIPHIVWHVNNTGVLHVFRNGNTWSEPNLLSVAQTGLNQSVVFDEANILHLVQQELSSITPTVIYNLFYYNSNDWERKQLTYCFNIAMSPKLIKHTNSLFIIYAKNDTGYEGITDVFIIKKQLSSDVIDNQYESDVLPVQLFQNAPNPFRFETNIRFRSTKKCFINIDVFNSKGQHVDELYSNVCESGEQSIRWDGTNSNGELQPSGMYFYRIVYSDRIILKKMIFLK